MKAYCSLRVCDMCREKVKIQVLAPWTDSRGTKRTSQNEMYCVAELFEWMRGTDLFQTKNVQIQWADQKMAQLFGGVDEDNVADDTGCGDGVRGKETPPMGQTDVHSPQTESGVVELETEETVGETYRG